MSHISSVELQNLASAARDQYLIRRLEQDRDDAMKLLASAVEPVAMYRAQAVYNYLSKLLQTLDSAKNLR